jgi:hypothetical protein
MSKIRAPGRPKPDRVPPGERRRISSSRLLGNCPPERHAAYQPHGRTTYSADEGQT